MGLKTLNQRAILAAIALLALLVVLAVPTLAAKTFAPAGLADMTENARPPTPPGQVDKPPRPGRPEKPDKPEKGPTVAVTISGTVHEAADESGRSSFILHDGETTFTLDAGPSWYLGNDHPLKRYVGQRVTVTGEMAEGSNEIDVESMDGTALREPGRPPWAGGWQSVGERHPGWSQDKADRFKDNCWPPGHCHLSIEE